jgi:hypothetical protein
LLNTPTVGSEVLDAAGRRAEAEARRYLGRCQFTEIKQSLCLQQQRNFVEMYVRAKSGDPSAMGSTASSFEPPRPGATEDERLGRLGLPISIVQTCAWRIVRITARFDEYIAKQTPHFQQLETESRARYANSTCERLTEDDQAAARRRAEVLIQELQTAPVKTPPIGWDPDHHGPPTYPRRDRLDSNTLRAR